MTRFAIKFAVIFAVATSATAHAQDDLEKEYQKVAKEILGKLRSSGAKTTGVLKFSARIGDGAFTAGVGDLNMRLAQKLELALVMANPASKARTKDQVGIVRNASDVAATIADANHLTQLGREALFTKKYPLAWKVDGQTEVVPDSFIVGVAQISADLSTMNIELMLVSKDDASLAPLAQVSVPTDLEDLIDSGESFSTRGIFDGGGVDTTTNDAKTTRTKFESTAKKKALKVRRETLGKSTPQPSSSHPLAPNSDAPISFEIRYDKVPQKLEFRNGCAFVKEPAEGQKVAFIVRRKGADKTRYGVLIKVNGENTLYRERIPNPKASLWIFEPRLSIFGIRGFQLDDKTQQEFKVLSDSESQTRAVDYGRDVGMITAILYAEETTPSFPDEDEMELAIQTQTSLPEKTAESRGDLGKSLFDQLIAQDTTRGLIVEGDKKRQDLEIAKFKRKLPPIMAVSIRYYRP